ncbi:MAG: lipid-A-disaccharide synthase [Bacteriovoracaceae bacterium]|jgi:lipid-A-disaccharide synthase
MTNPNCLIIAGEPSGEEHALSFFDDLTSECKEVEFWGVGGELLKDKGVSLIYHLKDFSSWGFSEVILKIPFYKKALERMEKEVLDRGTKVAILIDFQDFNLRLAKRLSKKGVKILYYVAPQAWVWKPWRAKAIEKAVHTLFTILPFEKEWFESRGVSRVYGVNHPLYLTYKDELAKGVPERTFEDLEKGIDLLLLPGSRNFEVKYLLPEFIQTVKTLKTKKKVRVHLVKSPNVEPNLYKPYEALIDHIYEDKDLPKALRKAHLCLAASGTVTLACALFEVPTVVCYKTSLLNSYIFYSFVNYKGPVALANIVHQERLFPELIQDIVDQTNIFKTLNEWIDNKESYTRIKNKLKKTKDLLKGDSSETGKYMASVINSSYEGDRK